ncbi:MAG: PQQ-dependent sugar dehydrogenase, partial [Acidobacteria bacterium]|nr:PQQ-dependent sugar dehydrogenase [Acidobacteriota bacterium]
MNGKIVSCLFLMALAASPQVRLERIATSISLCTDIQSARDGSGRLFLVRQDGTIAIWRAGQVLQRPFLDIRSKVSTGGERGLLGLAFPPNYKEKKWFYVNYTDRGGATVIARYQLVGSDPDLADPANERIVLTIPQPFANHNGGQIQFGPDGMMYIGMGDGGDANDPQGNGQNKRSLLGKMLRIDTESNLARYEIPPDNPFVGDASYRPEIWALGLRNPWRFSFDRSTGDLYIGDVGQDRWEEIDFQPRSSKGGENYGWVTMEGNVCVRAGCNQSGLTLPVLVYPHSIGESITGGYVYRGAYYYGDFISGKIWALRRQGSQWVNELAYDGGSSFSISTFGLDEEGELYVAKYGTGEVFRIIPVEKPTFSSAGVVSASSFAPGMTAGALMTVFTRNVLPSNGAFVAGSLPLPRSLGGIEVKVNGNPVPLLAVVRNGDSEQVNFQVPWELQPGTNARLQVGSSDVVEIPLVPVAPGVFGANATDALLIRGSDFTLVTGSVQRGLVY